ncbi:hypothetical protein [Longimicrobium sp.]|uniref:phage major capsid protein n=1 Tax=Longimicrobium sp. TaxID=2029185 RepID=UPI002E2FBD32|nr:hypothetical protein [Longimicrobium sp.]HEX6039136.1 hypothetical protein [Longimicrobium sp.]
MTAAHTRVPVRIQAATPSLSARVRAVEEAVWRRNDSLIDRSEYWSVLDVEQAEVVARRGQKTYRVPYTIADDGAVTFGEGVEVETQYVPVAAALQVEVDGSALRLSAAEADASEPEGRVWRAVIMRAGMSTAAVNVVREDGRTAALPVFFTEEYVRALVPMLANAPVYALDDTATGHKAEAREKLQNQVVGWTADPAFEGNAAVASVHLDEGSPLAEEKRVQLLSAWRRGNPARYGLSIDSRGHGEIRMHAGREVYFATEPVALLSTDMVLRPAAGGGFTQLVASRGPLHTEEEMNRDRLIKAIQASRPQVLAGRDLAAFTYGELLALANDQELRAAAASVESEAAPAAQAAPAATQAAAAAVDVQSITDRVMAAVALRTQMETVITSSQLPAGAQALLRRELDVPGATVATVQAAVDAQRAVLAEAVQGSRAHVAGLGGPAQAGGGTLQVFVGVDPIDKLQAAVDRAFGLEPLQPELRTIEPLGLRAAYNLVTCGQDQSVVGNFGGRESRIIQAAGFDTTTLPDVMANTLNRRLANDYAELQYGDENLVSTEGIMTDFRPQTAIRLGYLGSFPTVDTDIEDYPEISVYSQERAIWEPEERGILASITRKHIMNDDLGAVGKIPGRIARAGKRTVSEFLFSFITSNPVLSLSEGDTLTWFHASRNNLITDPLSIAALSKARLLLANQREPDSDKKLGLRKNVQLHLYVPQELGDAARAINQTEKVPGSANNDANPWYHKFGVNDEFIHEVYSWEETNDWVLAVDPKEREIIEIKFLNNQKIPQIVRQSSPEVGSMFTRGAMKMKAFFDFGGTPVDFRGVVKSVVPA